MRFDSSRRAILLAALCLTLFTPAALAQEWRFTDGTGRTITLDKAPERIVAFSFSAAALLQFGIRPTAIFADGTGSEKSFEGLDIEGITYIKTAWNELQPEVLLALEPDLIVTEYFSHSQSYSGGEEMNPDREFGKIAPILGVEQGNSVLKSIEDYGVLAEALGADLDAPEIAAQRQAFETARDRLSAAAAAKPGLKVLAGGNGGENIRIAVPSGSAELQDFMRWGVDIVNPEAEPGAYWAFVSWELASQYPADVMIVDDRFGPEQREELLELPAAQFAAPIKARQVGDWPAWWIRTYSTYASELDKLAALIERSEVITE